MHQSFLDHGGFRYLWTALGLLLAAILAYLWHDPLPGPNGGTWLGYTLGTVAAVLILWLTAFGLRKRSYASTLGTLRGWLSAHVYLGLTVPVLSLLHSGFQLGWNLHTLLLFLVFAVVLSGLFGVWAYARYPALITRNRDSSSRQAMLDEIAELDRRALELADRIDPKIHALVLRSQQNTRLGGGVWRQLTAGDRSGGRLLSALRRLAAQRRARGAAPGAAPPPAVGGGTILAMVDFLAATPDRSSETLRELIDLVTRKRTLVARIARDIQYQALLEIWLYLHVPLTFALLAALIWHVLSVFFYW
ncbi:MAG: hypothetical protein RML12_06035 [Xanthomonadales bacterium]|nr:hypothetical protein [Xanthomonadales bacterium]